MTQQQHIEVWLDETSDPGYPARIVSLETGDTSITLAVFSVDTEGYTAALERARKESAWRGIPMEAR
jgi:hypothetical protein